MENYVTGTAIRTRREQLGITQQQLADRLAVTPKYLSVVCNTVTGKSAQVVINDLTVQEIKRLLLQTDMSVKEICVQLDFVSLSFFCKYVKKHLGMTAYQYRSSSRTHSTK